MEEKKQLRMMPCPHCKAKVFVNVALPPLSNVPCNKCGAPIMIPLRLRQFELRSVIASGGMGTVYRSFDLALEREVALKVMKAEMAAEPMALESFYREARACASLNHTNIIHIYTFDEENGQKYLVMELADQGSLDSKIETRGRLSELEVLDVGEKVASALNLALKHGFLHRDIKPGNILFNVDNEPKLIDFGLARKAEAEVNPAEGIWGTPYYVAPEKIKLEAETFLSDMYSLGGTLYHALTGHVPFEAATAEEVVYAHVHTPLTPPDAVLPEISQACSDALVRAMAKDPVERFQTYDEFIMALTLARSQLLIRQSTQFAETDPAPAAAPESEPGAPGEKPARGRWWRRS